MKNILLPLLIVLTFLFNAHGQKKVAVVTFNLNKSISAEDLSGNAQFMKSILELAGDSSFRLEPVLEKLHDNFFNELGKEFPFELMDESTVINNEAYKGYESDYYASVNTPDPSLFLLPEGYKMLMRPAAGIGKKDLKAMLEIFPEADGIIFAYIYYSFEIQAAIGGMGSAKIAANYNLVCFNRDEKKVFGILRTGRSKKTVALVKGVPMVSLEKIQPMCNEAADDLMEDVRGKLPKIASKSGKKL